MRSSSGIHWWWKRGQLTASCTFMPKSSTLTITSSTVLMMVGPPGDPSASTGLPSFSTMVGVMEESGVLPRRDGVGLALNQAVHVGLAGLGREIVHLVVEQEAEAGGGDLAAVAAVQRVGHGRRCCPRSSATV